METLFERLKTVSQLHPDKGALRWRNHGLWREMSYEELVDKSLHFGYGLQSIGVQSGEHVAILSENRPGWCIADFGCNAVGAVSIPIHAESRSEVIATRLKHADARVLIISNLQYLKHRHVIEDCDRLRAVIVIRRSRNVFAKENVYTLRQIIKKGKYYHPKTDPQKNPLASIVYTAGTTGDPKGVMITNENFLQNIEGATSIIPAKISDVYFSFLPLSHVLERMAGQYLPLFSGATIAYSDGADRLLEDLHYIKPTVLIGVPTMFESIYEKILATAKSTTQRAQLLQLALKQPQRSVGRLVANAVVFRPIRNIFGGRLRLAVSGGAHLDPRINSFFNTAGVTLVEGYGLTEACPVVSLSPIGMQRSGTVGVPLPSLEVRVEANGELWVRGPSISQRYWNPEHTQKPTLDKDGWFHTGDIVEMDEDQYIRIIGRQVSMITMANGIRIAPERIEMMLNLQPSIRQSFVVGKEERYLAALIVPDENMLDEYNGGTSDRTACVAAEIQEVNARLLPHERIQRFHILDRPFSVEEGELTPTLTIRESVVREKFKEEIEDLYSSSRGMKTSLGTTTTVQSQKKINHQCSALL